MPYYTSAHPLDTDLADFVEGVLDPTNARIVENHLAQCLLCRIKRQRFVGQPSSGSAGLTGLAIPDFRRIDSEIASGSNAEPGELWIAGNDGVMVLVRTLGDIGAVVVPVTLDIDVADDETMIIAAAASPLGIPLALYDHLRVNVPTTVLTRRILPSREGVSLLAISELADGVTRGSAIEGSADPRLEIRQYLTDRLTMLDRPTPDPDDAWDDTPSVAGEILTHLRLALNDSRTNAIVDPLLDLRTAAAAARSWIGIARVEEFDIVVVVIDTPGGLNDGEDFLAAHTLLTRLSGSAIAVCASGLSDTADLYEAPGLFGATQLPQGGRFTGPLIANIRLQDLIAKYLDQKITVPLGTAGVSQRGTHIDVEQVLAQQVLAAVAAIVETGRKAHIPAKAAGYVAVGSNTDDLTAVLTSALQIPLDPNRVADLAGQVGS